MRRYPLCNNRPETAVILAGWRGPICWRCAGIIAGAWGGVAIADAQVHLPVALALALLLPCLWDGLASYSSRGTTNLKRAATGALAGLGAACALASLIKSTGL